MVEKAVQTLHLDGRQRRGLAALQERELQWERRRVQRNGRENDQARMSPRAAGKHTTNVSLLLNLVNAVVWIWKNMGIWAMLHVHLCT